jgi:hypothetical protein
MQEESIRDNSYHLNLNGYSGLASVDFRLLRSPVAFLCFELIWARPEQKLTATHRARVDGLVPGRLQDSLNSEQNSLRPTA